MTTEQSQPATEVTRLRKSFGGPAYENQPMHLDVNQDRCIGAGMCVLTAPEVFDQNTEDGRVLLLAPTPPPPQHTSVRQAAHTCPAAAITILDR